SSCLACPAYLSLNGTDFILNHKAILHGHIQQNSRAEDGHRGIHRLAYICRNTIIRCSVKSPMTGKRN
ncbi:MAG TPA: hypothetical protein VMV76_02140, partial [Dehalococcoidia bacterium]|nr:hypothetical protein [Dehalococcoidia bacterium]